MLLRGRDSGAEGETAAERRRDSGAEGEAATGRESDVEGGGGRELREGRHVPGESCAEGETAAQRERAARRAARTGRELRRRRRRGLSCTSSSSMICTEGFIKIYVVGAV